MKTTTPVKPVAPWVGGKSLLADTIINKIEKIKHTCYAEPFVGMGGVFLRRPFVAKSEVINDYSQDVANFFRILQRHYVPFMEMMRFQITTRTEFSRLANTDPATLTDLERAARFIYLQKTCFGGKATSRAFGVDKSGPARFDITKLAPMLEDLHTRLSRVVIECLPYQDFIARYDKATTLFYVDSPYYNSEDYYGKGMYSKDDHERLRDILMGIKGQFIVSLNDVPEVRKIYKGFKLQKVRTNYSVGGGNQKQRMFGEVIITRQLRDKR